MAPGALTPPPDASREPNLFNLDRNAPNEFVELSAGEHYLLHGRRQAGPDAEQGPVSSAAAAVGDEDSDPLCPAFDEFDDEMDYQRAKMAWNMFKIRKRELVDEGASNEEINRLRRAYRSEDDDTFMNLCRPPPTRVIGMDEIRAAEAEKIETRKAIEAVKEYERAEAERRRLALETLVRGDGRPRLGEQETEPASSSTGAGVLDDGYAAPHEDESLKKKPKPFEKTFGDAQTLDPSLSSGAGVSQTQPFEQEGPWAETLADEQAMDEDHEKSVGEEEEEKPTKKEKKKADEELREKKKKKKETRPATVLADRTEDMMTGFMAQLQTQFAKMETVMVSALREENKTINDRIDDTNRTLREGFKDQDEKHVVFSRKPGEPDAREVHEAHRALGRPRAGHGHRYSPCENGWCGRWTPFAGFGPSRPATDERRVGRLPTLATRAWLFPAGVLPARSFTGECGKEALLFAWA